jgi:hypothetical protein
MPAIVPLIVVFLSAIAAAFSTLAAGLSAANDVMSAADGAQSVPPAPQTPGAIPPVPFPGETSEGFHTRHPDNVLCDVPLALKWDPWFVLSTPSGFKRGAWIPADAPFTQPVG